MKKFYVLAIIITFCFLCYHLIKPKDVQIIASEEKELVVDNPQEEDRMMKKSNHLKFKGIPIDGTLEKFVSRMERKGFERIGKQGDMEVLQGDFADFKSCTVYVATLDNKDLVSRITVVFPAQEQWTHLYGDYKHLKDLLTEKYGEPEKCTEKIYSMLSQEDAPENDGDKMRSVQIGSYKYETQFTPNNGEILLRIERGEMFSCFVTLSYEDKANGDIIRKHAKEDL